MSQRHDYCFFITAQKDKVNLSGFHRRIDNRDSLALILHRYQADPIQFVQRPHTFFNLRYRSTDRLYRAGAPVYNLAHNDTRKK